MQNTNTVAELAIALPAAIPVLERLKIDYCCHGNQSIEKACGSVGITPEQLLNLINKEPVGGDVRSWDDVPLTALISFIVDTHHAYTRSTLSNLQGLASKVVKAHGAGHPELVTIEGLVAEATNDLLPHMMKEEQILFPYVAELERAQVSGKEVPMPFFGTARNPIRMMMIEHEAVGEKLAEIRAAANDYTLPEDACTSFTAFYKLLAEFEADIHRHIHVENNVLFPRTMTLETLAPKASAGVGW
jgi:regulator of cell morphogenesis and NO signaling